MSDRETLQQALTTARQPDPLQQAADRIERVAETMVPRMEDIEKRQERQEGEMATQKDLTEFQARLDEKLDRFAHQIADDMEGRRKSSDQKLKDDVEKSLREMLSEFIESGMPNHVRKEVDLLDERRRQEDDDRAKKIREEREASRRAVLLRLSITTALISIVTALFLAARYIWGLI